MALILSAAIAAAIAGLCSVLVAWLSQRPIRRRLAECERDRVQMRQLLALFVAAIVGIVPEQEREKLLEVTAELAMREQLDEWQGRRR